MTEEHDKKPEGEQNQNDDLNAMEYEFDEEAEQLQGKLAADNVEDKVQDKEQVENPEDKTGLNED